MDIQSLRKMTVAQLRDEARKIPDASGLTGMKKDELVALLARHHGIAEEGAAGGPRGSGGGATAKMNRTEIKQEIRRLKKEKEEALAANDREKSSRCNRRIRECKRALRRLARDRS
jgi:hypothetical protein